MKKIVTLFFTINLLLGLLDLTAAHGQEINPLDGISMEKAKQIALKQVKGRIVSAHKETDDGMVKYEIIIQTKNSTYEVEIAESNGKVLEVEKEGSRKHHGDDDGDDDWDEPNDD